MRKKKEKMETMLRDSTFYLKKKALITYDVAVPVD